MDFEMRARWENARQLFSSERSVQETIGNNLSYLQSHYALIVQTAGVSEPDERGVGAIEELSVKEAATATGILVQEVSKYAPEYIQYCNVNRIRLVKTVSRPDSHGIVKNVGGLAYSSGTVYVATGGLKGNIHHELLHRSDQEYIRRLKGDIYDYNWARLNPDRHVYLGSKQYDSLTDWDKNQLDIQGFITHYGLKNVGEDRAQIHEALMSGMRLHVSQLDITLVRKFAKIKEFLKERSDGKMDDNYLDDLARNAVGVGYWFPQEQAEIERRKQLEKRRAELSAKQRRFLLKQGAVIFLSAATGALSKDAYSLSKVSQKENSQQKLSLLEEGGVYAEGILFHDFNLNFIDLFDTSLGFSTFGKPLPPNPDSYAILPLTHGFSDPTTVRNAGEIIASRSKSEDLYYSLGLTARTSNGLYLLYGITGDQPPFQATITFETANTQINPIAEENKNHTTGYFLFRFIPHLGGREINLNFLRRNADFIFRLPQDIIWTGNEKGVIGKSAMLPEFTWTLSSTGIATVSHW